MEFLLDQWYGNAVFDFYLAPSLIFLAAAPLKWGSWQVPRFFSSAIVYMKLKLKKKKILQARYAVSVSCSPELGKGFCEGNSLSGQEEGKGRWFSHAINTLEHQYRYMMLEKSLPSSCPAAQICHHRWVPEDHIYKIDPASPASLPTQCLAVCRPVKKSVLHWWCHWSCSVPRAWFRREQEGMPKRDLIFC